MAAGPRPREVERDPKGEPSWLALLRSLGNNRCLVNAARMVDRGAQEKIPSSLLSRAPFCEAHRLGITGKREAPFCSERGTGASFQEGTLMCFHASVSKKHSGTAVGRDP